MGDDGESAVDGAGGNPVDENMGRGPFSSEGVPCLSLYSVANIRPEDSTHGSYLIENENHNLLGCRAGDTLVIVHVLLPSHGRLAWQAYPNIEKVRLARLADW